MEKEDEIDIKEMLELQLAEVEMLMSMFPQKGEFVLDDEYAVREIQAYVNGDILLDNPESRIGFTVHITTEKYPVELVVHLPHEYPAVYPETFLRTQNTTRESSRRLNEDLNECMQSLDKGEICVGTLIQWVQENIDNYFTAVQVGKTDKSVDKIDTTFSRLWIYSHHIYSKFKRRDILDWAQELKLTGFSMPGKPGVMCVEGYSSIVEEFWYRIRRMNWKKIAVKEKEDFEINPDEGIDKYRKFSDFQELSFDVQAGKAREYHMNLGKFYEYLVKHDSKHIFPLYFGVEGKSAQE